MNVQILTKNLFLKHLSMYHTIRTILWYDTIHTICTLYRTIHQHLRYADTIRNSFHTIRNFFHTIWYVSRIIRYWQLCSWISMDGQVTGTSHSDSQPLLWMTVGRSVLEKSDKMTWRFEWMPHLEKFFEKSYQALSSRNRTYEGVGSEEVDAPEWRGFRDEVDLRLGAMTQLT